MPKALDYREIDQAILSNPDRSANEIRSLHQLKCSHTTVCRRMLELNIRVAVEQPKKPVEEEIGTARNRILALCPHCGKTFKTSMFWTGNGMPRIFCVGCKRNMDKRDIYCTTPDSHGGHRIGMVAMRMEV